MKLYSAIGFIMLIALFAANIFGVHNHLVNADVDYPVTRNLRDERTLPPAPKPNGLYYANLRVQPSPPPSPSGAKRIDQKGR